MAEIFNVDVFHQRLKASNIGRKMVYSDVTGSTMDDARKFGISVDEYPHGTIVMAERQTKARGARNHKWDASNSGNIYVSVILHMAPNYKTFEGRFELEVAACMAVFSVVHRMGIHVVPKWPNDLWVRGHKLAGFLVEDSRFDIPNSNLCLVILGMGINVNADIRQNPDLCSIATSLFCERNGVFVSREMFFAEVCDALEETLLSKSDNLTGFCSSNLFQKGCDISATVPSESRVIDGEFVGVCDNWDVTFIDKRTKIVLQGRSDYYTIRPKVQRKILVVFSGVGTTKSASVIASRLMSIVDTSKHVVCSLPESAITQGEEWMKTCDLLVLAEDVCNSLHLTSKLTTYLKMGGNLMTIGLASYFTAKIFGIPFKEGLMESVGHNNTNVSVISVENQLQSTNTCGDQYSTAESQITFPTSLIYFKFSKDFAAKDLISELPTVTVTTAENQQGDGSEKLSNSTNQTQSQKPHFALNYVPCLKDDKYCIAILTRPTTHGGSIALFGFDFGVALPLPPSASSSSQSQSASEERTDSEKLVQKVDQDRFKRDQLLNQVLNVLHII